MPGKPRCGCWKEWTYATTNHQAGKWSNGKLLSMRRHNWVVYPPTRFPPYTEPVPVDPWAEESYTYDGIGGRISRVTSVIGTGEPAGAGGENANTRPVFLYDLEYDPLGNVVSRSYPSCTHRYCIDISLAKRQRTVEQTFSQGLLASVPGYASSVSYHPNGLVDRVRHENGVTWIQANDPNDMARPARIRTSGAPSSEQSELDTGVYAYDAAGNVTRTGADRYAYDLLSRIADARLGQYVEGCPGDLTLAGVTESVPRTWETCGTIHGGPDYTVASDVTLRAEGQVVFYSGFSVASGARLAVEAGAAVNDAPATPVDRAQSYSYDRFGNLLSMTTTEAGGSSTTRTFATNSSTNRLSSSLVLYDSSGNVTARQMDGGVWWDFDHDPFNMLRTTMPTSTTGYEYLYGPGDERIGVIDWTGGQNGDPAAWIETYTLRDLDGSPLRQYRVEGGNTSGHWAIIRDYIWRGSSLLALETPLSVRHMHPDHLGSPRLITDATGTTVAKHVYFPFGEEATDPTQDAEVTKFTVHERDFHLPDPPLTPDFPVTLANVSDDLDYMHARYFSPHLGRFMSVDPAKSAQRNWPQSWNRYSYTQGNPLKYIDPDGETVESALELIGRNAGAIQRASFMVGGHVTPIEIARVLFQENRNDYNLIRYNDSSAAPVGGSEIKNGLAIARFNLFGSHGSFGIAEMRTDTAAKLFGWDPENLTAEQRQQIQETLSDPELSIKLIAVYLFELKRQRPDAPTEVILSDYNRGVSDSNVVNEVGGRSGPYLQLIGQALDMGFNTGGEIEVVRCGDEYKFSSQCGPGSK